MNLSMRRSRLGAGVGVGYGLGVGVFFLEELLVLEVPFFVGVGLLLAASTSAFFLAASSSVFF